MSRNEDFDNGFWSKPGIEPLSMPATLLYIWTWTNPRCGMAGLYEVGRQSIRECKVPDKVIDAAFAELAEAKLAFYIDHVVWVRGRVKRLNTTSPKIAISILKDVNHVPVGHPLRDRFIAEYLHDESWITRKLRDQGRDVPVPSRNPIETVTTENVTPHDERDHETLSKPSPEGPLSGTGKGPSLVVVRSEGGDARGRASDDPSATDVRLVYDVWIESTERSASRCKLTDDRRRLIVAAIKRDGLDDVVAAVTGIGKSKEARSGYGRGTRLDDIQQALRTRAQMEKWRDFNEQQDNASSGVGSAKTSEYERAMGL